MFAIYFRRCRLDAAADISLLCRRDYRFDDADFRFADFSPRRWRWPLWWCRFRRCHFATIDTPFQIDYAATLIIITHWLRQPLLFISFHIFAALILPPLPHYVAAFASLIRHGHFSWDFRWIAFTLPDTFSIRWTDYYASIRYAMIRRRRYWCFIFAMLYYMPPFRCRCFRFASHWLLRHFRIARCRYDVMPRDWWLSAAATCQLWWCRDISLLLIRQMLSH